MDESQMKYELGLRIKSYRKDKKLTQEDLTAIIGLEQSNLSNIETGKSFPEFFTFCSFINNTNVEPNYLLDFLRSDKTSYNSLDFEIINLLIKMPNETKKHFRDFLIALQK